MRSSFGCGCWRASAADGDAIKAIGRIAVKQAARQSDHSPSSPVTAGSRRIDESVAEAKPVEAEPIEVKPTEQMQTFTFETVTVDAKGTVIRKETHQAEYLREQLGDGVELDMVAIPGGTFQMGSNDSESDDRERPVHLVTVEPFWMGKYPVTQAQWRAVAALPQVARKLEARPSKFVWR